MTRLAPSTQPTLAPFAFHHAVRAVRHAVGLLLAAGLATAGHAQSQASETSPAQGLLLQPSAMLLEKLPEGAGRDAPTFVWGDRISGESGTTTTVDGHAELRRHDTVIRARHLQLQQQTNDASASGDVSIMRNGNRFSGPTLTLNLDTYQGFFTHPTYELLQNDGRGQADQVEFKSETLSVATNGTYTTCKRPGVNGLPDWWVGAKSLELDNEEEVGRASSGALYFKGVPILAAPYVSFPLSDKRKSGLLPPTINLDNISGLELTLPYYWNIAPNFDATLYPTLMSKRGIDMGGEFRYLMPGYKGLVRADFMPSDKLSGTNRWGLTAQHNNELDLSGVGLSGTGLRLNFNRVSDDYYWRDFPRATASLTQRLLSNDVVLNGNVGAIGLTAGFYTWQTLQDPAAPIIAPYDRVPQIELRRSESNQRWGSLGGLDWSLNGQFTRFTTPRVQTVTSTLADINGSRVLGVAQISRTWQTPGWFIRPKAQLHVTQYQFDQVLWTGQQSVGRVVPTVSLDSGLVFERDASFFGRQVVQTLEPRAFYVHTPYRDQNSLPNYDSGARDFNFTSAWAENDFSGNDRISDTHALTLGLSSRLIDPETGVEAARFGVAQRLRMADQNVVLPGGTAVTDRVSDVLLGSTLNWTPHWSFDGAVQFNPQTSRSQRTTLSGRYNPTSYRVFSAAYRLQRAGGLLPASEQVDVGWQWPLNDLWDASHRHVEPERNGQGLGPERWYGVGRINYSMPDRKVVDLVAGIEYDAGCWLARVVVESLQRSSATTGQRVLLQLEFSGFTRIGSNPLQTLKANVPRYQYLREQVQAPSRFGVYE
jgi:LPS-assembly protein